MSETLHALDAFERFGAENDAQCARWLLQQIEANLLDGSNDGGEFAEVVLPVARINSWHSNGIAEP